MRVYLINSWTLKLTNVYWKLIFQARQLAGSMLVSQRAPGPTPWHVATRRGVEMPCATTADGLHDLFMGYRWFNMGFIYSSIAGDFFHH
jgi:hypothetical protein